jgi:sugar lactone lactonase YvrE
MPFFSLYTPSTEQTTMTPLGSTRVNMNKTWRQNTVTVAGGNGNGNELNQLSYPRGIFVDDDNQCIYIADWGNRRIVKWKYGADNGEVVVGGNGQGNRTDQLHKPTDVIVDKKNDSLIVCDQGNRQVVRWSRRNVGSKHIIISSINCYGLAMDNNGDLYVSDNMKNEVRKYRVGSKIGTLVAGGNGKGNNLNQLDYPNYIFVDQEYSVYVSDCYNHRVTKWMKGAKEGIVVAGGQGGGNSLIQLFFPNGIYVDHLGNAYVADYYNHRIVLWSKGVKEGSIVVGGNEEGKESNQFNSLRGVSFDRHGNLYVVDMRNHRVQKFEIRLN